MSKSIWPWIFLLAGWIALASFLCKKYLCGIKTNTKEKIENVIPIAPAAKSSAVWNYNDGSNHRMGLSKYFQFNESKFNHLTPLGTGFNNSMQSTADYLVKNPQRQLSITGYYRESETNNSILPNLGLARANNIASYLKGLGVPADRLITKASIIGDNFFKGGTLEKGADFSFSTLVASSRIPDIKSRLVGKPLTLYFNTNANSLSLSSAQRTDFADMIYYLDNVPSSNLSVIGHTDGSGSRRYNIKLSADRAEFVRDYLISNGGIQTSRMNVSGLGPDQPIASNSTTAGKAKNRRVEVTLN